MKIKNVMVVVATLAVTSISLATQFTINSSSGYAQHWDDIIFLYDPISGWSSQRGDGNVLQHLGHLQMLANDGSVGETVDVRLNFDFSVSSSYLKARSLSQYGYDADEMTNFAGMDAALISNSFYTRNSTNSFGDMGVEANFSALGIQKLCLDVPWTVASLDDPDYLSIGLPSDNLFLPSGLKVFDQNKSAIFGISVQTNITFTGAEVADVPDAGATIALIGFAFIGLTALQYKFGRK